MTDQEMLKEARDWLGFITKIEAGMNEHVKKQRMKTLSWLIEQVEQNKRYREALEAIYELAEYDEYDNTLEQIVSEVEKALEGEE